MIARLAAAAIALAVCFAARASARSSMESEETWAEKRADREIDKLVSEFSARIDTGVRLHVVVADPQGEILRDPATGLLLLPKQPKQRLRIVRTHDLGGMLSMFEDRPTIVGPSKNPRTWLCSLPQEEILFYDGRKSEIIKGSEGAGKSRLTAMLHYVWWISDFLGEDREVGALAPTKQRLKHVRLAMGQLYDPSWYKYSRADMLMTFACGHRIQFVSTKITSELQGSPAQGFNWSRYTVDEVQNVEISVTDDLESRGREAEDGDDRGVYTCTVTDNPEFRSLLARKIKSGDWIERKMYIAESPFVPEDFLAKKRRVMTPRDYRRRYEISDEPPERLLYFGFDRKRNLRPIPYNAKDITPSVLASKTGNPSHALLVGNDPGIAKAASMFLRAYKLDGIQDPVWWVRAELFTRHKSTEEHARLALAIAQERFACNVARRPERMHVRPHPFGQSEHKPSKDVYRIWQRVIDPRGEHGEDVMAAQYKVTSKHQSRGTGLILKDDRIAMLNRMFFDADHVTHLYIECDAQGQPVAPLLVDALETMERDEEGKAETEAKDEHDKSDPPSALGYAVWPWEKESEVLARERARGKR